MKAIRHQRTERANIFNRTPSGKLVLEGEAELIEFVAKTDTGVETWKVRFLGDDRDAIVTRRVD